MSAEPAPYDAAARLADATRALMDAVVRTQVSDTDRSAAAATIERVTAELSAALVDTPPQPPLEVIGRGIQPYSPVTGGLNPYAPPLVMTRCADGSLRGEVTMQPIHEGPPGSVHGGLVATLLDHLLGIANALAGVGGMTKELTVRYRRPTPFGVPLVVLARHDRLDGRHIYASGEVVADGDVTAEASGVFVRRRSTN